MAFNRVHHIVVRVKDIDAGIASYQAMGLTLDRTGESEALGIKQAFFNLGDGSFIEVVAPVSGDSAVGKALESRGEGVHSIVFAVDNVGETSDALSGNDVALIGKGGPQVFIHPKSSHGVLVQLTDRPLP